MKYLAQIWLYKHVYLAVLDTCLVLVEVDKDKNPVKWSIFSGCEKLTEETQKTILSELNLLVTME